MGWYKVVFGQGQVERREAVGFIEEFGAILRQSQFSLNVALLHVREEPNSQSTYYLTPAAAECFGMSLEKYQAKPVEPPEPATVYVSVGVRDSIEHLYKKTKSVGL
jgi:hypothetical protein